MKMDYKMILMGLVAGYLAYKYLYAPKQVPGTLTAGTPSESSINTYASTMMASV